MANIESATTAIGTADADSILVTGTIPSGIAGGIVILTPDATIDGSAGNDSIDVSLHGINSDAYAYIGGIPITG